MQSDHHTPNNLGRIPLSPKKRQLEMAIVEDCPKRRAMSAITLASDSAEQFLLGKSQSPPAVRELAESPATTSSPRSFSNASSDLYNDPDKEHVIELSSIERCMPRAYIRVCLAYRLRDQEDKTSALRNLNEFIHKTVNAKPYLAGFVVPQDKTTSTSPVEVRFTNSDYENYPDVEECDLLDQDGKLADYDKLDKEGLPPSSLSPEKVAKLPASMADEKRAPVFRARANITKGGMIISFYLHHCISDGMGLSLLVSGSVTGDAFMFARHINDPAKGAPLLGKRLSEFANMKTILRKQLSWSDPNQISSLRSLSCNRLDVNGGIRPSNPPGRGCVISFDDNVIDQLRGTLEAHVPIKLSKHDVLQALIWRSMSRARFPAIKKESVTVSKLLIPVDIRKKITPSLPESYFGAAVDFATAECELDALVSHDMAALARAAHTIHQAVHSVDEPYVRQAIALARSFDPNVDVRDLLASNLDRVSGADMYITSWERLGLYTADLGMGLGEPDWVRKPWSRDPGSCIILPRNPRKEQFEVVVQMTTDDMARLLEDTAFRKYVTRVID